jgi:hypothetical protein
MTSPMNPVSGMQDHPAGQIVLSGRDIGARVNALAGYRVDVMAGRSLVSRVDRLHPGTATAN